MTARFDTDWLVVGSGFGGSVSALRLAEKGHSVSVLESGRRFADTDLPKSTSRVHKYYYFPFLAMRGIFRLTLFKDVFIASGAGVGGGSLGYAMTLYRSRPEFARNPQWASLADWDAELDPHYQMAERMLGVVTDDRESAGDDLMRQYASEIGVADTFAKTRVGVFLGSPGTTVPDPYFDGDGPERAGCIRCGGCLVGCRHNAKNTLLKNYLWFAERRGATVTPDRAVIDIRPLGDGTGADGYAVTHIRSGSWLRRDKQVTTARGVVVAAGALGTTRLLHRCKLAGSLPRLSDRLGYLVRTNSESCLAVTAGNDDRNFNDGVALTSSIYPTPDTHIEPFTYGPGGNFQSLIFGMASERGGRGTRPFYWIADVIRRPGRFVRSARMKNWSRRTVILAIMQTLDNSVRVRVKYRLPGGFPVLTTEQDPDNPNPDYIPEGYRCANWIAKRVGGVVQAMVPEATAAIPTTGHLLGGAVIGGSRDDAVVNMRHEAFGYQNLLVTDGAAVPANIGVNPSLTITAMAERAMSFVGAKPGGKVALPIRFTSDRRHSENRAAQPAGGE